MRPFFLPLSALLALSIALESASAWEAPPPLRSGNSLGLQEDKDPNITPGDAVFQTPVQFLGLFLEGVLSTPIWLFMPQAMKRQIIESKVRDKGLDNEGILEFLTRGEVASVAREVAAKCTPKWAPLMHSTAVAGCAVLEYSIAIAAKQIAAKLPPELGIAPHRKNPIILQAAERVTDDLKLCLALSTKQNHTLGCAGKFQVSGPYRIGREIAAAYAEAHLYSRFLKTSDEHIAANKREIFDAYDSCSKNRYFNRIFFPTLNPLDEIRTCVLATMLSGGHLALLDELERGLSGFIPDPTERASQVQESHDRVFACLNKRKMVPRGYVGNPRDRQDIVFESLSQFDEDTFKNGLFSCLNEGIHEASGQIVSNMIQTHPWISAHLGAGQIASLTTTVISEGLQSCLEKQKREGASENVADPRSCEPLIRWIAFREVGKLQLEDLPKTLARSWGGKSESVVAQLEAALNTPLSEPKKNYEDCFNTNLEHSPADAYTCLRNLITSSARALIENAPPALASIRPELQGHSFEFLTPEEVDTAATCISSKIPETPKSQGDEALTELADSMTAAQATCLPRVTFLTLARWMPVLVADELALRIRKPEVRAQIQAQVIPSFELGLRSVLDSETPDLEGYLGQFRAETAWTAYTTLVKQALGPETGGVYQDLSPILLKDAGLQSLLDCYGEGECLSRSISELQREASWQIGSRRLKDRAQDSPERARALEQYAQCLKDLSPDQGTDECVSSLQEQGFLTVVQEKTTTEIPEDFLSELRPLVEELSQDCLTEGKKALEQSGGDPESQGHELELCGKSIERRLSLEIGQRSLLQKAGALGPPAANALTERFVNHFNACKEAEAGKCMVDALWPSIAELAVALSARYQNLLNPGTAAADYSREIGRFLSCVASARETFPGSPGPFSKDVMQCGSVLETRMTAMIQTEFAEKAARTVPARNQAAVREIASIAFDCLTLISKNSSGSLPGADGQGSQTLLILDGVGEALGRWIIREGLEGPRRSLGRLKSRLTETPSLTTLTQSMAIHELIASEVGNGLQEGLRAAGTSLLGDSRMFYEFQQATRGQPWKNAMETRGGRQLLDLLIERLLQGVPPSDLMNSVAKGFLAQALSENLGDDSTGDHLARAFIENDIQKKLDSGYWKLKLGFFLGKVRTQDLDWNALRNRPAGIRAREVLITQAIAPLIRGETTTLSEAASDAISEAVAEAIQDHR